MALVAVESKSSAASQEFSIQIGENYETKLKQSIQELIHEFQEGIHDLSAFSSKFFELMQAKTDPALDVIWVYSALSHRCRDSTKDEALDRVAAAKDLFQLLTACSASCSAAKSIALLAPVIFEVYGAVGDVWGKDLSLKREKKVMREIESLFDIILGYISVCWCRDPNEEDGSTNLIFSFVDLVRIWVGDRFSGDGDVVKGLKLFFPLVSDETCEGLVAGETDISYLAGVVAAEVFLLRLCLKFRVGIQRSELQKDLRTWAVGSITSFHNYYFFETLVRMLLETTLPVTSLLKSEEEILLRKIMYDAVILVEYSFLKFERVMQLPGEHIKGFAMTRLLVTHNAIEFFRENGDQKKAVCYMNAFSSSSLPFQLIKWVTNQIGKEAKDTKPTGCSPKAIIKWFLELEDRGILLFDGSTSKYRARLVLNADYEPRLLKAGVKNLDDDLHFYIDNKGEGEEEDKSIDNMGGEGEGEGEGEEEEDKKTDEYLSAAFVAASHSMKSVENDSQRKRKVDRCVEKKKQVKFLKYDLDDISESARENLSRLSNGDGFSSGSEVENLLSDEDLEVRKEQ